MSPEANDYAALALIVGFMAGWMLAWHQRGQPLPDDITTDPAQPWNKGGKE